MRRPARRSALRTTSSGVFGETFGNLHPVRPRPAQRSIPHGCLRQVDFLGDELAMIDRAIAEHVLASSDMRRLLAIPGVDAITAATMMATIGRIERFPTARQLVGYVGLDARVRQSGNRPARHGRISKQSTSAAHHVLVQAAWAAIKTRVRCARVTGASRPAAAPRSRSSPSPASSASSPGTYSPGNRATPTNARAGRPQAPPPRAPESQVPGRGGECPTFCVGIDREEIDVHHNPKQVG
jgi:transposase